MVVANESEKLLSGNMRFRKKLGRAKLIAHSKEQRPFAMIIGCSDSRMPPEVIFDQAEDIGRLFVIRVAGNIAQDRSLIGSIEYAVNYLKVPLVAVLGHTGCGAINEITKSIMHKRSDAVKAHDLECLAEYVRPCKELGTRAALYGIDIKLKEDALHFLAKEKKIGAQLLIEANVDHQVNMIRNKQFIKAHEPEVIGLVYSLDEGRVHLTNKGGKQLRF